MTQAEIDCYDNYYARLANIRARATRMEGGIAIVASATGTPNARASGVTLLAPTASSPSGSSLDKYLQPQDMCGEKFSELML